MLLYLFNIIVIVLEFVRLLGQIAVAFFHRLVQMYVPKKKKSVTGKVVLITGAAHGLGAEMARKFAKLGATLVLWDIDKVSKQLQWRHSTALHYLLICTLVD